MAKGEVESQYRACTALRRASPVTRGADQQEMSKQTFDQPEVIVGQVRVECRVTIWMRCPSCHQEHGHILTARDCPDLAGLRYWRIECHGTSYFLRLSSEVITDAVAQAAEFAVVHRLSQRWLTDETYECACRCSSTP